MEKKGWRQNAAVRTRGGKCRLTAGPEDPSALRPPIDSTGTKQQTRLRARLPPSAAGLPRGTGDCGARGWGGRGLAPGSSRRPLPTPPCGFPRCPGSLRPRSTLPRQVVRPQPPRLPHTGTRGDESTAARDKERRGDGRGRGSCEVFPARQRRAPEGQGESAVGPAGPRLLPPRAGRACAAEAELPGKPRGAGGQPRRQVSRGPPRPHRRRQEEEGATAGFRGRGRPARGARDLVRPKVDLTGF
uniref:translation initiation factor IF-2-like n=1 Tax=Callithrix jacchus TaxID=9483 RepID=UPI00159D7561|nr:translation initiation factor IF-2-like [Callithrix jacchus]